MTMSTVDRTSPNTPDVYPANRIDKNAAQNSKSEGQAGIMSQTSENVKGKLEADSQLAMVLPMRSVQRSQLPRSRTGRMASAGTFKRLQIVCGQGSCSYDSVINRGSNAHLHVCAPSPRPRLSPRSGGR